MKRHGNLYYRLIDMDNLRLAFDRAKKGKTRQRAVLAVAADVDGCLRRLHESLATKTFRTSPYSTKVIHEPKTRTIYRLPFYPDRIVQHALMQVVEPIWDALFIADSYACRTGKGQHAGSKKTMECVRKYRYCLKCDVSKFYPSVDHDVLYEIVQRKIKCPDILWLLRDIIYSVPGGKNVPIGNYTSQWFGNLYMNELDKFIKQDLKITGYVRYCDDFCLFHDDKAVLHAALGRVTDFLQSRLRLRLSKKDVFPVTRGVDFLGYRHFQKYILLRKSTAKRVKKRLRNLPGLLVQGKITLEHYRSSLASTLGWLQWANTHNFRKAIGIDELWSAC